MNSLVAAAIFVFTSSSFVVSVMPLVIFSFIVVVARSVASLVYQFSQRKVLALAIAFVFPSAESPLLVIASNIVFIFAAVQKLIS
ncbi:MAG: hypothetical protein WCH65_02200 [bacterium]